MVFFFWKTTGWSLKYGALLNKALIFSKKKNGNLGPLDSKLIFSSGNFDTTFVEQNGTHGKDFGRKFSKENQDDQTSIFCKRFGKTTTKNTWRGKKKHQTKRTTKKVQPDLQETNTRCLNVFLSPAENKTLRPFWGVKPFFHGCFFFHPYR